MGPAMSTAEALDRLPMFGRRVAVGSSLAMSVAEANDKPPMLDVGWLMEGGALRPRRRI